MKGPTWPVKGLDVDQLGDLCIWPAQQVGGCTGGLCHAAFVLEHGQSWGVPAGHAHVGNGRAGPPRPRL